MENYFLYKTGQDRIDKGQHMESIPNTLSEKRIYEAGFYFLRNLDDYLNDDEKNTFLKRVCDANCQPESLQSILNSEFFTEKKTDALANNNSYTVLKDRMIAYFNSEDKFNIFQSQCISVSAQASLLAAFQKLALEPDYQNRPECQKIINICRSKDLRDQVIIGIMGHAELFKTISNPEQFYRKLSIALYEYVNFCLENNVNMKSVWAPSDFLDILCLDYSEKKYFFESVDQLPRVILDYYNDFMKRKDTNTTLFFASYKNNFEIRQAHRLDIQIKKAIPHELSSIQSSLTEDPRLVTQDRQSLDSKEKFFEQLGILFERYYQIPSDYLITNLNTQKIGERTYAEYIIHFLCSHPRFFTDFKKNNAGFIAEGQYYAFFAYLLNLFFIAKSYFPKDSSLQKMFVISDFLDNINYMINNYCTLFFKENSSDLFANICNFMAHCTSSKQQLLFASACGFDKLNLNDTERYNLYAIFAHDADLFNQSKENVQINSILLQKSHMNHDIGRYFLIFEIWIAEKQLNASSGVDTIMINLQSKMKPDTCFEAIQAFDSRAEPWSPKPREPKDYAFGEIFDDASMAMTYGSLSIRNNKDDEIEEKSHPVLGHSYHSFTQSIHYPGFLNRDGVSCYINSALKMIIHVLTKQDISRLESENKINNPSIQKVKDNLIALWKICHLANANGRDVLAALDCFMESCKNITRAVDGSRLNIDMPQIEVLQDFKLRQQGDSEEVLKAIMSILNMPSLQIIETNEHVLYVAGEQYIIKQEEVPADTLMLKMLLLKNQPPKAYQDIFDHNYSETNISDYKLSLDTLKDVLKNKPDKERVIQKIKQLGTVRRHSNGEEDIIIQHNTTDIFIREQTRYKITSGHSGFYMHMIDYEQHMKQLNLSKGCLAATPDFSIMVPVVQDDKEPTLEKFIPTSLIAHTGVSLNCGHYIAYTCADNGDICEHDDYNVTLVSRGSPQNTGERLATMIKSKRGMMTPALIHYKKASNIHSRHDEGSTA